MPIVNRIAEFLCRHDQRGGGICIPYRNWGWTARKQPGSSSSACSEFGVDEITRRYCPDRGRGDHQRAAATGPTIGLQGGYGRAADGPKKTGR